MNVFNKILACLPLLLCFMPLCIQAQLNESSNADGKNERQYLIAAITKIADPVLNALSKNQLRLTMPVEGKDAKAREYCSHLEAFARLLDGMAPWLELGPDNTPEGKLREKYIELTVKCIRNGTDPKSPDFFTFNKGNQPLVDAAFFAEALLRAPKQLWGRLDSQTRLHVINALKSTHVIIPSFTNHVLFSAVVEAALLRYGGAADNFRMDYPVRLNMNWYFGDGVYGDGPVFHWDYYNSYVIQPMMLQVLEVLDEVNYTSRIVNKDMYNKVLNRARRYAAIEERLISPDGTYPAIGRSLAYRFGAFHLLSLVAYKHQLPEQITPQQVRAALYAVIKKQLEAPGTFDKNGWLRVGFFGYQPAIGENYISTGSLYLCSEAFIILGLPPGDALWQGKDVAWTQKKIWSGENVPNEHALHDD
jgi:hypothetical protein